MGMNHDGPTIDELYPDLDEERRQEARENLDRHFSLTLRIYERVRSDPAAYEEFKRLTESRRRARMEERSNHTNQDS